MCASLQVHVEVPAALSTGAATDVAKPLKVLIAGIESAVGIRWVGRWVIYSDSSSVTR